MTGPFLERLAAADREALLAVSGRRSFAPGEALIRRGDPGGDLVCLLAGHVKVNSVTARGREVVLAFRGPGDVVGELGAMDGAPRMATVVAVVDVEAAVVARHGFRAFLAERPEAAMVLLSELSERLRDADAKRIDFAALDTLGRVAARLLELADRFGVSRDGGIYIELPITQEELAGWCGASLEATAKALATMRRLHWVDTGRRAVTLLDHAALEATAR